MCNQGLLNKTKREVAEVENIMKQEAGVEVKSLTVKVEEEAM